MITTEQITEIVQRSQRLQPRPAFAAAEEAEQPELGLLILWKKLTAHESIESGRILAIESARRAELSVAQASLGWLIDNHHNDLGILLTVFSYLHRELAEKRQWPRSLTGQVLPLLKAGIEHPEVSVRAEVLSLLSIAEKRKALGAVIHAQAARPLSDALVPALTFADDDEREALARVQRVLRAGTLPAAPTFSPRALQRIVLDLLDVRDSYQAALGDLQALVDFVRHRALLDDAGSRVSLSGKPMQTIRVHGPSASARVVRSIVEFAEAVVGTRRSPDFDAYAAPDFGVQVEWAPAASVPLHLAFFDDDARAVFDAMEVLAHSTQASTFEAALDSLAPVEGEAFMRMVSRLRQHDETVEIVLTDPASPAWQRHLQIGPLTLHRVSTTALMRLTRASSRGHGVAIAAEHIPQANTVRQVFQAMDAMLKNGEVNVADIDEINVPRQVNYYKQGARILGLFDEDNQPTSRAHTLATLSYEARLTVSSVYFEDSAVGRAWRQWSGVARLIEVKPETATDFLEECAQGLSGSTPARRASTLRTWLSELVPHYPGSQ